MGTTTRRISKTACLLLLTGTGLGGCVPTVYQPPVLYPAPRERYYEPRPVRPVVVRRRVVEYDEPVVRRRPVARPIYRESPPAQAAPNTCADNPGLCGGGGGGGRGGGGGGGGGWSDMRLKHTIELVGFTAHGLPLYAFDYIWGGDRQVGVMAQDVLDVRPDTVIHTSTGYLKVDYDKLGIRMMPLSEWKQNQ